MLEKISRSLFLRLFIAFFLVVTVAFAVEAWLAIRAGEETIEPLVLNNLAAWADDVLQGVDRYLSDRCGEVKVWSTLSTMDEVLVRDRFMNIENLLLGLWREFPAQYTALTVLDPQWDVVASTDPSQVGRRWSLPGLSVHPLRGTQFLISDFPRIAGDPASTVLLLHPIISRLKAEPIGWLAAGVSWHRVEHLVASAQPGGGAQGFRRFFILIGPGGQVLAGNRSLLSSIPPSLVASGQIASESLSGRGLRRLADYLTVVSASPSISSSPARDLRVVALWKKSEAFSAVRIFILTVVGTALLALTLAAGASFLISRAISQRLRRLFEGTSRLARGELTYRVEEDRLDEFGDLARSFNLMAEELARVRSSLESSVARWEALVTHAPDFIITVNREGVILFVNRVIQGLRVQEVSGSSVYDFVSVTHRNPFREALRKVFETGEDAALDLEGLGEGEEPAWYSSRIGAIQMDGRVAAATIIATDITDRRRLEREILEISEIERERIGLDLHDGLGQILTGVALLSRGLEQKLASHSPETAAEARQIRGLISEAIQQTRAIAKGFFPVGLDKVGLRATLEELALNVEQTSKISCSVEGSLDEAQEDHSKATHLFRIAQEAISNSLRHSNASHIWIRLSSDHHGSSLGILDDGVGFRDLSPEREGMGLRTMRYRAEMIGATLEIQTVPTGGASVFCRFP